MACQVLSSGAPEASDGQRLVMPQVIWKEASRTGVPLSPSNEPGEEHALLPLWAPPYMRYWGEEEKLFLALL